MKLPRDVSGDQLADHICRHWDYTRVTQVGSHIMLRTETPSRSKQVIPAHKPMKIGTSARSSSTRASHAKTSSAIYRRSSPRQRRPIAKQPFNNLTIWFPRACSLLAVNNTSR